jgi:spore coat protein U-like protein
LLTHWKIFSGTELSIDAGFHFVSRVRIALLCAAAAVALASEARAQTCRNITVTALAFGNYDVFTAANTDSAGTISYRCSRRLFPTVTVSLGSAFAAGHRRMTLAGGGDFLSYDVYSDAARTAVWSLTPVSVPSGGTQTVNYFGRAFALQDVTVGSYTDTLVVTFNF